jgi:predicted HicB family RNase H-like nuclease
MSEYMKYKDYLGTISYSAEDEVLYGKVHGINDLLSFEGRSVKELKKSFKEAIDDYLKTCKDVGKSPDKTYKGTFNVRIGTDLHKHASLVAFKKSLSLNDFVKQAIAFALENEGKLKS